MTSTSHAKLSPSSAARWLRCLGSVLGSQIDDANEYADDGTASHTLAAWALGQGKQCADFIGQTIDVCNDDGTVRRSYVVDEERASYTQVYVDSIRDRLHPGAELLVEQRVDTGIHDDEGNPVDGTADAIILSPTFGLIDVHDLKYGKGHKVWGVRRVTEIPDGRAVGPALLIDGELYEMNPQLALYGLGALNTFGLLGDFSKVTVTIHQPRLDHMSSAEISVDDLLAWRESVAQWVLAWDTSLHPGEEQCRWCPRKTSCPRLAEQVLQTVMQDFGDVADLSEYGIAQAMEHVELIEDWLKAIKERAWGLAERGQLPGWKLVEGRQGNRQWTDETQVAEVFKKTYRMRDDEMYSKKLISPAEAEKRMAKAHPTRWERLQEYIKRGPASKTLVRESDPRAAAGTVIDDFKPVGNEFADLIGAAVLGAAG